MRVWACLLCLSIITCSACSGAPAVKAPPSAHALSSALYPVREVRIVILAPDAGDLLAIEKLVREGSEELSAQVGISLRIVGWRQIRWQSDNRPGVLREVLERMSLYEQPYDMAVGVRGFGLAGFIGYMVYGGWEAVIDDTYRRFIVIRRMTVQVLLHEVCHAFLLSETHTWGIRHLMTPVTFYVIPGIMPLNRSTHLNKKDREEIIRNKWRDFSGILNLPRSQVSDPLDPVRQVREDR
jgi:hypothetical protein